MKAWVRLVLVSSEGAPGAGLSVAFGAGGGAGRIATARVRFELTPEAVRTDTGPVTAPTGTFAFRRCALPVRTFARTSSDRPLLPWNTTAVTPASAVPVIFRVLPPRARCREAQARRQETLVSCGFAVQTAPPPLDCAWAPPPRAAKARVARRAAAAQRPP